MAKPVLIECPEGEWTLVAENVVSGTIRIRTHGYVSYLQTYRDTGDTAPISIDEGATLEDGDEISEIVGIDVYVWAEREDGSVIVYLP